MKTAKRTGSSMNIAVLDANVLFPMLLRDTLLRCAAAGLFQIRWSSRILDEMSRNLISDYRMPAAAAGQLREIMEEAFPDAKAEGWEELEKDMRNDIKDRHVAAAAAASNADVIVTANLRDFYDLPIGVEAIHPDDFLCALMEMKVTSVMEVLVSQAAGYRRPELTVRELLDRLSISVPQFAELAFKALGN